MRSIYDEPTWTRGWNGVRTAEAQDVPEEVMTEFEEFFRDNNDDFQNRYQRCKQMWVEGYRLGAERAQEEAANAVRKVKDDVSEFGGLFVKTEQGEYVPVETQEAYVQYLGRWMTLEKARKVKALLDE
jgi:hypothetical protein